MPESFGGDAVKGALSRMAEGSMSKVVSEGDRLNKIFIEAQRLRYSPRILGHFQRMRHARPVVIAVRGQKYLRLVLEPSERFAVQYPVPVPLKDRAYITLLFGKDPSAGFRGKSRPGSKNIFFSNFKFFSDRQWKASSKTVIIEMK